MKTIAIANQKGGTGKTTTTYNLGIALTQQGYRVLMVDFDPQGNLSCYCGIPPEKDLDQTITELLMKTSCEKPIGNRECVYQTGRKEAAARVDFIPSNLRLAGFELAMGTMMCREVLLKSCLEQYNNRNTIPPMGVGVKKRATPSTVRITEAIVSRTAQISNRNTSRAARRDNAKAKGATNIFSSIFIFKTSFIYPSYLYFIMPARGHKCCERLVNPVLKLRVMLARSLMVLSKKL